MPSLKKILVTGSNGQLGSELKALSAAYPSFEFIFLTRNELPLQDAAAIEKTIGTHQPQYVINCAAYTAVDKAESERDEAFLINATAVGWLAEACKALQAKFIHISTDYVFDGATTVPLKEDNKTHPLNVYGESKLAGEHAALKAAPQSIIIRTSWVYSPYGKNFVKTMLRLLAEKESISVVADQWGSPTYAADLAAAIMMMVEHHQWQPGIYHFSNEGIISWAQFATEIGNRIHSSCVVNPIPTAAYPTPAKRPLYSVMDKSKIKAAYGIEILPWQESLQHCLQKIMAHQMTA